MALPADHPRHAQLMEVAVRRSLRAVGRTAPNPCVGAVIARDGRILAVGHHARAGGPHAEVNALAAARESVVGADVYVTLEPCAHHGRTPPCAEALVAAGVGRVFAACSDPNPKVNGQGFARLKAAGIEVHRGLLAGRAGPVLEPFFHWVRTGQPQVILKAAVSLDGRIATHTGASAGLSGPAAHAWLHRLRDRVDAILVGVGTVLADNPRLTPRGHPPTGKGTHRLNRLVLDTHLRTPLTAHVLEETAAHPTWLLCGPQASLEAEKALVGRGANVVRLRLSEASQYIDIHDVIAFSGGRGWHRLLVEGGGRVHGAFMDARAATEAMVVTTPRFLGSAGVPLAVFAGPSGVEGAPDMESVNVRRLGQDTLFHGRVRYRP